jgi:DNA-binding transcriptional ArsR family regulator
MPDYELVESLDLTSAQQHRAVGNRVRWQILGLLGDRATTITQLAGALGILKGSASYHVRVLEQAGLIRVVRTRKVRGVLERYYGRTARRYELDHADPPLDSSPLLLRTIAAELEHRPPVPVGTDLVTVAHARLDPDRATDFAGRLAALVEEFRLVPATGGPMYGMAVAFFQTAVGATPPDDPDASNAPDSRAQP